MILLTVILAIMIIAVGLYSILVRFFFNFTLERNTPIRLIRFGHGTCYEEKINEGRLWLQKNDSQIWHIRSYDGLDLVGHYFPVKNPKRCVIFFHGWRGCWDYDCAPFARWYNENDTNLLVVEQRGQGNSEGKYIGMGIKEQRDCLDWINFYLKECGEVAKKMPIYIHGVSMGATTVLMAAGEALPKEVKGIIADCGYTNPYDMFRSYGKKTYGIPEFPVVRGLYKKCIKKAGIDIKAYSTTDAMKRCSLPVLFVHGKADDFVIPENTELNYKACISNKKMLLLVEDAKHCMSFLMGEKQYTEALFQLFNA